MLTLTLTLRRLARRVFRVNLVGQVRQPSELRELEPTRQNSGGRGGVPRGGVQYARCVQCRARVCTSVVKVMVRVRVGVRVRVQPQP